MSDKSEMFESDHKIKIDKILKMQKKFKEMKKYAITLPIGLYNANNFENIEPEEILNEIETNPNSKFSKILRKAII